MSRDPADSDNNKYSRRKALIDRMQNLGQMASAETALNHQSAAAKNGLGITDMRTASTLMQEGPVTAGRLSLTTGTVTNVIDGAWYAARLTSPTGARPLSSPT